MIILQILAFLLLIPFSILVLIFFNLYVLNWNFLMIVALIGFIFSGFCGLLFLSMKVVVWTFVILAIFYVGRMKYIATKYFAKNENYYKSTRKEHKMSEEKKLILEMLQSGKINVDEAEKLLEAQSNVDEKIPAAKSSNKKFLRVLVNEDNKMKVNINIPLSLAEVGLKLIPKDKLNIAGNKIDLDEIVGMIKDGNDGEFVNVDTMDNGKEVKVRVFIA